MSFQQNAWNLMICRRLAKVERSFVVLDEGDLKGSTIISYKKKGIRKAHTHEIKSELD